MGLFLTYQKIKLFEINKRFRNSGADDTAEKLVNDVKEFERYYAFPTISYNFLPQLIYDKIKFGLDVDKEREQIHRYVEQEGKRQENLKDKASADAEKKLANSVLGLTILTLASVLYDLTSFAFEIIGTDSICCRRWVAACVFIILSVIVYWLFKRYIDEWRLIRWIRGLWKRRSNVQ